MTFEEDVLNYHKGGKIGTRILTRVSGKDDLSKAYSPGVAVPCLEIAKDDKKAYEYTAKGNRVAVVSNGTAVLGLGNIGAVASKPVMEGKALLFKHFGGIDAVDVEVDSVEVDEIVRTVELISPTYGGINLEDFKAPECFEIEERLKKKLGIPVMHDDQHGTAIVVGAGLLNALKKSGKKISEVKVVINGAGAAGIAIGRMMLSLGVGRNNLIMCDSKGIISKSRGQESGVRSRNIPYKIRESSTPAISHGSLEGKNVLNKYKAEFAVEMEGDLADAVRGSDVFVGVSVKGALTCEMLKSMTENPIVFALANPNPEIDWNEAHETRDDVIMATGRSDFPNQVNNVLAFPGIFRGVLDCRASEINEEMKVAAIKALASINGHGSQKIPYKFEGSLTHSSSHGNLGDDESEGDEDVVQIIPGVFDKRVVVEVACGVARAAVESGVAGMGFDLEGYKERLEEKFLGDNKDGVKVGERYRHFKGAEYEVVAVGRDSDDVGKRIVVYRGLYDSKEFGRNPVWVRDYEDFVGWKEFSPRDDSGEPDDGRRVRRFERV